MVDLNKYIPKDLNPKPKSGFAESLDFVVKYIKNLHKKPVYVQIGTGGCTGLILGGTFSKTSRFVSVAIGVSIIIIQFFIYKGYIRFNESRIERDVRNLKESVLNELGVDNSIIPDKKDIDNFVKRNLYTFGGLTAGTLIGYGIF
uniref:FUN14 family protein n=1 Tax=Parastrongyloides trichosuri TaxID=131310 RepID=A0A0N4ZS05_PARTI